MRPRAEVAVTLGLLAVIFTAGGILAGSRRSTPRVEEPSTLIAGPGGAQGYLESVRALGVGTRRYRGRAVDIGGIRDTTRRQLLMLLSPGDLTPAERTAFLRYSEESDVLLAGARSADLMGCFGYTTSSPRDSVDRWINVTRTFADLIRIDTVRAVPPGAAAGIRSPWVGRVLRRNFQRTIVDTSRKSDAGDFSCTVPEFATVDTLLVGANQTVVALRMQRADSGSSIYLVADVDLFRNRMLRDTDASLFTLGLVAGNYDEVIFEERHHGFGSGGSLTDFVLEWSSRSPWGWLAWQLAAVGMIVLISRIPRFGPTRAGFNRTRRSSLEHVRALATALSAAHGHDEAIAAMIRGLRRRLVPAGARSRGDWRSWLQELHQHATNPRAKVLVAELITLTHPGQPAGSVFRAANTVEDLWTELRP